MSAIAGRQLGVIGDEQLLGLGFSRKQIQRLVQRQRLHVQYLGAYSVGHRRVVSHARLTAALLSCGCTSFLSHRTAAAVWGLRPLNIRRVDVTVPRARLGPRRGLVIHQALEPAAEDVLTNNGHRVSSVARLLVELSARESLRELDRLVTEAVRKGILDFPDIEAALARHAGRPGMAKLRRALRDYTPGPDRSSNLELAFDQLIAGPDIPEPRCNVIIAGYECDRYWPEHKLVVELDGRNYHRAVRDMERDKRKDAKLALLGITVIRVTELRFGLEPEEIRAEVRAMTGGAT
ncbi:MAG TPA: DUF559 domain-containing protein [Solirubrobacteraceae bacterium]